MTIRYGARSLEALRDREVEATSVGAWANVLTAGYETDPDLVAAVLPPPLEPADEPLVRVTIATVDVGRGIPVFGAGTFAVRARHEGVVGDYPLVMPMTTEQAVVGGRETFGEPKKLGAVTLTVDDDGTVTGSFARMGVTFVEVSGRLVGAPADAGDPALEPRHRTDFYVKFLPAPDGKGFDSPPSLVYCHRDETTRRWQRVDGSVLLRESRFDPVADLPVRRLVSIELAERNSVQRGEIVARIPDDWLAPYTHQRYDDLSPLGSD